MATLDDLRDALTQLAAEADVAPGHAESAVADARYVAVAPANTTGNRWPILAVAAAVTLLAIVAGILLAFREPDAILITDDLTPTPTPTPSEPDAVESSLRSSGVYDRGQDQTLTLDPDSDERLRGVVVATLDGDADAIAVATDGALGVLEGTTLRIVADGEELAARDFAASFGEFGRPTSPAFDVEGTLWAWTGDGVAGLRRDGSNVDVEKAVPPITVPSQEAQLRISGANVSVVRYDGSRPDRVEVVSVVGSDPLAGVRNVDTPVPLSGRALPPGVPYIDGLRTIVTSEWLLTGSIVGSTTAELQWRELPDDSLGYGGADSEAPIVADTAASLSWMNIFDGAFLAVHRSDGTAAVAVVEDPGERFEVAVSPDGAVHLVTRIDGSITVRTLLDADLRPLQGPPAPTEVAPQTPAEALAPLECGEPQRGVQVVDDVDLDADGAADRVTIDAEGVILACLADGRQAAVAAFPSSTLARADLGGRDGVIVTLAPGPGIDFHTQNYLFRYRDGELQVLGYLDGMNVSGLPDVRGLVHVFAGEDFPSGENVDQSTPGSFGVFGCRPSGIPDFDFDLTTLIHYPDGRLYSETRTFDAEWSVQMSLDTIAAELVPKWPATASRADLDQVLRDAGFAPGCLPVGPDD